MAKLAQQPWLLGIVSAALLLLPFSITVRCPFGARSLPGSPLCRFSTVCCRSKIWPQAGIAVRNLAAYLMGFLWYVGNCYWIYQTMLYFGGLPPSISAGILIAYSMVLGLYFAVFGLLLTATAKAFRSPRYALLAAPFFWVALELLSSRFTKVPWDLLGYSQIDNFLLTSLAPVHRGLWAHLRAGRGQRADRLGRCSSPRRNAGYRVFVRGLLVALVLQNGDHFAASGGAGGSDGSAAATKSECNQDNGWPGAEYEEHVNQFVKLSTHTCGPHLAGMPELDAYPVAPDCPTVPVTPGLIVWPESPAPFFDKDPRLLNALRTLALSMHAPVIAGTTSLDPNGARSDMYNSALFILPDGVVSDRYDKIHLVPWGEYIPYKSFFSFAKNLTQAAGDMTHGWRRVVFSSGGHRFGVFICYEEIFGDEIRQFVSVARRCW